MRTFSAATIALLVATWLPAADEHAGNDHGPGDHEVPTVTLGPDGARRQGIEVAAAKRARVIRPVQAPAWVSYDPDATAHVGTVVAGRVAQVRVKLGDTVKAGDPLVVIDSAEMGRAQSEFLQALANADAAQTDADVARQSIERAKGLEQVIAPAERQRREADLKRAIGAAAAAKAAAQTGRNGLMLMGMEAPAIDALIASGTVSPRITITAPIAGLVIARNIAVGKIANPEHEALVTIVDPSEVWVVANVPEGSAGAIRVGDQATVTSPLLDAPLDTTITWVSATVDADTRSVPVRMVVPAAAGLKPGAFAQVEIRPKSDHGGMAPIAVPSDAVFSMNSVPTVFVPGTAHGSFVAREVEVGQASDGLVAVTKGLAEGDLVVVRGGFILKAELGKSAAKGCCDDR
jgi:membrane fusion protein, heavy metal efflux system